MASTSQQMLQVCVCVCVCMCACVCVCGLLWCCGPAPQLLWLRHTGLGTYITNLILNLASCRHDEDNEFFAFCEGLFFVSVNCPKCVFLCCFSRGKRRKERKERWWDEWIFWTQVIYSRGRESEREWERVSERGRISKPFSYFQNGVGNQQLDWAQISDFFYLFTAHKGLILGLLEPPM